MSNYTTLSVTEEAKDRFVDLHEETGGDLTHSELLKRLIEHYQFQRLEDDKRIEEARQVVADDHNMQAEDVTLEALLKVTAGAYCGYQQTSDWDIEESTKNAPTTR